MISLKKSATRSEVIARIHRLSPEHERRWGRMQTSQVLAHMCDALRLSLGEIPSGTPAFLFSLAPVRFLLIHKLLWGRGKAKAPREAFTSVPDDWEADRATLLDLIERFAATDAAKLAPIHPIFGKMSANDWDVLMYRHLDHHLTQFGV